MNIKQDYLITEQDDVDMLAALRVHRDLVALLLTWNNKLEDRVERLEAIIMSMAAGSESSWPDDGNGHTHWVYPANRAKDLVKEIEDERAAAAYAEYEADLTQEEYERQRDEEDQRLQYLPVMM